MKLSTVYALLLASQIATTIAHAANALPNNVTTKPFGGGKNQAIDTIDYSFDVSTPIAFSKVKMCVASIDTNNAVELRDSAGAFVSASGVYHQSQNNATIPGGDIFKYVDDSSKSLIAQGSIRRAGGLGGVIKLAVRYQLDIAVEDSRIRMRMSHIEQAMQNTGIAQNDGFAPIGVWTGSMYKKDMQALDALSSDLKTCMVN